MSGLLQDLRYAVRQLRKAPGFATVAIVTLALGIGANTAIFSLLDQALLRNLPLKGADRLVILKYTGSNIPGLLQSRTDGKFYFSYPMYRDLRDRNSVFSGLIATDWTQVGVQWHNQPDLVAAELVSGNYFDVLGLQPAFGRLFLAADDLVPDANPVVVLSFSYWQRRFGSDPGVLNQSILVNGHPFTVVGVAPPGFHSVVMGDTPDAFLPMMMQAQVMPGRKDLDNHHSSWLNIIGKLKPGVSREQAEAGVAPVWYTLRSDELKDVSGESEGFRDRFLTNSHLLLLDGARGFSPLRSDVRTPLLIVMGMVALVALMACANVGSLLLVRASGRIREMSVRYALGAKRKRVIQQLLVEGFLLGSAGGLLGMLLAPRVSALLINMMWSGGTGDLPFSAKPDLRIMLFNCGLALFASLLFSMAPAAQFWRPGLAPALKQQGTTARSGPLRFRRVSVALQIETQLDPEQRRDFERGLAIIEDRTASLNRFLQTYRQLAQMPPPAIKKVALLPIVERVVFLETRVVVAISRGPDVMLMVDSDQIEQMLINLVRNAVEAALEPSPKNARSTNSKHEVECQQPQVMLSWAVEDQSVEITIEDNGLGLLNPSNAFVPFYTTKPSGSGIGLALSRQIVEAHGGSIELSNLNGKRGCRVRVRLPCS